MFSNRGYQFLPGILLISAKQKIFKQDFVSKQLYEVGAWFSFLVGNSDKLFLLLRKKNNKVAPVITCLSGW